MTAPDVGVCQVCEGFVKRWWIKFVCEQKCYRKSPPSHPSPWRCFLSEPDGSRMAHWCWWHKRQIVLRLKRLLLKCTIGKAMFYSCCIILFYRTTHIQTSPEHEQLTSLTTRHHCWCTVDVPINLKKQSLTNADHQAGFVSFDSRAHRDEMAATLWSGFKERRYFPPFFRRIWSEMHFKVSKCFYSSCLIINALSAVIFVTDFLHPCRWIIDVSFPSLGVQRAPI